MAEVMGAEAAIVRIQFVSGTHAIATALFAVLRPGDELLAVAGKPYDTLEEVCLQSACPMSSGTICSSPACVLHARVSGRGKIRS